MSTPPSILESTVSGSIPETKPPSDVPWWGALILAILVSVVSVVGTIYAMRPAQPGVVAAPGIG
jgi:drug/metabolite transporter (DMT)-like permease